MAHLGLLRAPKSQQYQLSDFLLIWLCDIGWLKSFIPHTQNDKIASIEYTRIT